MNIRFLLFITLSFFSQLLIAQDWPKVYAGILPQWLTEHYDQGFFFCGPKIDYHYGLIFKTDINGNIIWKKTIGNGTGHWFISSIEVTEDGGFIISGGMRKYDPVSGNDPFLMKFSACGLMEWCQVINTPDYYDYAICAKVTPTNEYILLTIYSDPSPWHHTQLYKFYSTGALIWRQDYPVQGSAFEDTPRNLRVGSSIYLISGMCYYPDPGIPGGYERPYYICTDTAGNVNWRLVYGAVNGFHGMSFFSPLKSTTGFFYDITWHSNFCDTPALIRFSSTGEESYFQDLYPEACPGGHSAMNWIDDSTLVAFVGGNINGVDSSKWMKFDTLGFSYYNRFYTETWITGTQYSIIAEDGKICNISKQGATSYFYKLNNDLEFDSIYTMPHTYDSLCPSPIVSDTVDPDCDLIVTIQDPEQYPETYQLKVYPNPAANTITVEIPQLLQKRTGPAGFQATTVYHQWGSATLEVYNLYGKKQIEQVVHQSQSPLEMNVSRWPRGMYVFRLSFRGEMVAMEKVVVGR